MRHSYSFHIVLIFCSHFWTREVAQDPKWPWARAQGRPRPSQGQCQACRHFAPRSAFWANRYKTQQKKTYEISVKQMNWMYVFRKFSLWFSCFLAHSYVCPKSISGLRAVLPVTTSVQNCPSMPHMKRLWKCKNVAKLVSETSWDRIHPFKTDGFSSNHCTMVMWT